ncbi:MAG: hypothetical protein ACFBWO_05535 [Paracoccaceae bacterium]
MTPLAPCLARRCLDTDDLAALREATESDRVVLAAYLDAAEGATTDRVCARLRADLRLARARGDAAHAARLLAALGAYLTEHGVSASGCPGGARPLRERP